MAKKAKTATQIVVRRAAPPPAAAIVPARRSSGVARVRREYEDRLSALRRRAAQKAKEQSHRLTAAAAGAGVAIAEAYMGDTFERLAIGPLRPAATLGLLMYLGEEMGLIKGRTLEHVTTGVLSVGVYQTVADGLGGSAGSPTFG